MIATNIFAHTGKGDKGPPEYVSINRLENGDVRVTVRGKARRYRNGTYEMVEGITVETVVPASEWERFGQ
jgi:hypothetical protein